jgi:hypothetical protein
MVLPDPGSSQNKFFLPSSFSLKDLFEKFNSFYKEAYSHKEDEDIDENHNAKEKNAVSWGYFWEYWNTQFPFLKRLGKRTDFCNLCCGLRTILNDKKSSDEEKKESKLKIDTHLNAVKISRDTFNENRIKYAQEEGKTVISFDYSENIMLPILKNTPAAFYFKTRRKISLFGITNEKQTPLGTIQHNYLTDECHSISKGPNSVISYLHHYVCNILGNVKSLVVYADNCAAQNKNQYVIAYFSYLVKVMKQFNEIDFHFLISGHTKFSPDSHFGNIKRRISIEDCQSIIDLVGDDGFVHKSSKNNIAVPYIDPISLVQNFKWMNWKKFLSTHFKNCSGIGDWHVIKIRPYNNFIEVANDVGEPFREYEILPHNWNELMWPEIDIIEPDALSQNRIDQLKQFEDYVSVMHKPFISTENY